MKEQKMKGVVQEDDYIILFLNSRKKWLIQVKKDKEIHTHAGFVNGESLIGKSYGSEIVTNTGKTMYILDPKISDFILKSKRPTQILYPKDIGMIINWTDLSPGKNVLEVGTGSGSLSCYIANIIRPSGHLFSYEIRKDHHNAAQKNISKTGLLNYMTLINKDIKLGIEQKDIDVAIIDVGDPWSVLDIIKNSMRLGGSIASVSPTVNQVEKFVIELINHKFIDIETYEVLVRKMEVREGKTRPAMRMIGHTTYLTFARKGLDNS